MICKDCPSRKGDICELKHQKLPMSSLPCLFTIYISTDKALTQKVLTYEEYLQRCNTPSRVKPNPLSKFRKVI